MSRWSLLFVAFIAACGGRVVVDHDDDGGGGKGGAPVASLSDEEICDALCPRPAVCGEGVVPCTDSCLATLASAGSCRDIVATMFVCGSHLNEENLCGSAECDAAGKAVRACILPAGACDDVGYVCVIGEDGSCKHTCGGVEYDATCPEKEPLGWEGIGTTCTCRVDGVVVGTCAANVLDPTLEGGCCAAHFAESG